MRTLRSGKPLPDPPPVMRGSRGSGVISTENISPQSQSQLLPDSPTKETIPIPSTPLSEESIKPPTITQPPPTPTLTASESTEASGSHFAEQSLVPESESASLTATDSTETEHIMGGEVEAEPENNSNDVDIGVGVDVDMNISSGASPQTPNNNSSPILPNTSLDSDSVPGVDVNLSTETPVKRGRGRPPKYPKLTPSSNSEQIKSEPTPTATRGRGRPPTKSKVMPPPASATVIVPSEKEDCGISALPLPKKGADDAEENKSVEMTTTTTNSDGDGEFASTPLAIVAPDEEQSLACHETIEPEESDLETTPKKEKAIVQKSSALSTPAATPTTELRRSLRCPKKKPATIVQATMAVERDAQPFHETCSHCGEEFMKKSLFLKHSKIHTATKKIFSPPKKTPAQKPSTSSVAAVAGAEGQMDQDDDLQGGNGDGQQYQDYDDGENSSEGKPPIIPFTKKRPSITSLTMKDPVYCAECGMTFTRRAHLNRHMLLHSGVKPFVCDICKLRFTRKDHMFAHKMKHEKDHKIKCAQCGTIFQSWKILEDHIQNVHTTFKTASPGRPKSVVKVNTAVVTNPNPDNTCEICGKKFLQRRYLRAHRKLHLRKEANIIAHLRQVDNGTYNGNRVSGGSLGSEDSSYEDEDMYGGDEESMDIDENILNPEVQIYDEGFQVEGEGMSPGDPAKVKTEPTEQGQNPDATRGDRSSPRRSVGTPKKSLASLNRVVKLAEEKSRSGGSSESGGSHNSSVISVDEADLDKDELDEFIDYDYKAMMHLRSGKFGTLSQDPDDDDGEDDQALECSVCGETFSERAELRKHYRIHQKKFICRFCGLKLASAGSLMRHNLIHTGKKEFSCSLCDRRFSRKDTLMVHLQAHEKSTTRVNMPKPFSCKICSQGYTMKYNLIRHIKMCHGSMTVADRATILKQIAQKYKNGIPTTSTSSMNPGDDDDDMSNSGESSDFLANGVKIKTEPLDIDEDRIEEEKIDGDRSLSSSPTEEDLKQCEQDEVFNNGDDGEAIAGFKCNHCAKVFKNAKSLNTHKWYHARDKQFICQICNRGFKYSSDLGRHALTHANEKPKGSNPSNVHVSNGNDNQGKAGQSPNKQLSNTNPNQKGGGGVLQQLPTQGHQPPGEINSMDARPFSCKICPQRFNHRSNLSRHVRLIHKITSPVKRGVSINVQNYLMKLKSSHPTVSGVPLRLSPRKGQGQSIASPSISQPDQGSSLANGAQQNSWNGNNNGVGFPKPLDQDGRRSSGTSSVLTPGSFTYDPTAERPYICNTCGKTFETKSNLWTHSRIHNKIFGCDYCELKMATRGDLILHLRTHTGEKPFECHLCEWKFSRKSGLNKHIEKYHGPGGKQLRPFKFNVPNPGTNQIQRQPSSSSPGMQISNIPKMPSVRGPSVTNLMSQQRSSTSGLVKSVLHKSGGGLTITRTKISSSDSRYSCRLCTSIIIGKVNYVRHMNDHLKASKAGNEGDEGTTKFSCKECGQEYRTQEMLTRHILTHSDADAPRCTLCGKSCSSLGFLKRHYQYVHPNEPNPADQPSTGNQLQPKKNDTQNDGNLKPIVIRKVIRDENGDEESDEEFPNESDEPPNMIQPGTGSDGFMDVDVNNLDEDEIEYATVNPSSSQHLSRYSEFPQPCDKCGKEFTTIKARADHVWYCKQANARVFHCPITDCTMKLKARRDLVLHLRHHWDELNYQCRICTARFPHKKDSHRHMKEIHNFTVKSRANPCDFCDLHFVWEQDLNFHLQSLHGVNLADVFDDGDDEEEFSGQNYQNEDNCDEEELYEQVYHQDDGIPDPTSFLEQSMGISTAPESATTHDQEEYSCPQCNKSFATRQKWLYHRYYHVREEKYDCQDCDEKFKLRSHLERHIRTYHNEEKPVYKILNCKHCPRKFTREYDLTTHVQKVHLQIPMIVQNKRLSVPAALKMIPNQQQKQMRISHLSILKPSFLSSPPKQMLNQSSTSSASKVVGNIVRKSWPPVSSPKPTMTISSPVSAVKPRPEMQESTMTLGPDGWYTCNLCGKSFKEKKSIDAHRYYHNREEKHFCTHCGARFKQKSDLHRHVRIHHNSNNPKNTIHCPHCYRSFTDIRYMRMHIRRYHGELASSGKMPIRIGSNGLNSGNNQVQGQNGSGVFNKNFDDIEGEEMDWEGVEENEDDDQKEMMTMEEMEYLQYQNEEEDSNGGSSDSNGGLQLTISCESCGAEIEMDKIAEHACTTSEEDDNPSPSGSGIQEEAEVNKITDQTEPDLESEIVAEKLDQDEKLNEEKYNEQEDPRQEDIIPPETETTPEESSQVDEETATDKIEEEESSCSDLKEATAEIPVEN